MKYKYIFFDVANTLLYKPLLYSSIQKALFEFEINVPIPVIKGKHLTLSNLITFPAKTTIEFYKNFNSKLLFSIGIIPEEKIIKKIYEYCKDIEWELYEDTSAINSLNLPVGIISNWDNTLETLLSSLFKVKFFKIVTSYNTALSKPDPKIFLKAIKNLDCSVDKIAYVGNSIAQDILPSEKVGMSSILIDRDDNFPFYKGDKIKSLWDLDEILQS